MQLSFHVATRWQTKFRAQLTHWLSHALSALAALDKGAQPCARNSSPALESHSPQAALSETTNETDSTHPPEHLNLTPQNWLAQQPPESAIVVYISKPSLQIMELFSLSREKLIGLLRFPMHRDPELKWAQPTGNCLRRMDFDPATEFAAHAAATEDLEFLLSARRYLSIEMITLDLLVSTLFAEVCPDLADAAHTENTNATETYNEQEAANQLAKAAAKSDPNTPDNALFAARLAFTIRHARSKITPTNKRELLACLLHERKLASEEMAQLDTNLLPAMRKLGLTHDDD